MQQSHKADRIADRRIVWVTLVPSAITLTACTQYHVAMDDGGGEHGGSGGTAGSTSTGKGGSGGSNTTETGGSGGSMTTGAGGGSGGMVTGLDGGVSNAKDAAAEKPVDAPFETGTALFANGASCNLGTDCQSKNCVDGVCCDSTCTGQCQSCGETNSVGKCVTVNGAVRGKIRPTCTGTGACAAICNGSDPMQCHYPGSEKQCGSPTCSAGIAHAAATCDGAGNCPAGATTDCDPFICGATACKTTCATSADCTTSSYCAAPNCVSKKGLGSVCAAGEQCTTSICGGRCCSAPCTCPQQSTANVLTNAGFDSNLNGWSNPAVASQWTGQDVDGCPFSGAMQVIGAGLGLTQCVAVTPGASYTFAGWFRNPDAAAYVVSFVGLSDANCTVLSDPVVGAGFSGAETSWTFKSTVIQIPANGNHVRIEIDTNPNLFADKLSLSPNGTF